jgi:hypothetical protein
MKTNTSLINNIGLIITISIILSSCKTTNNVVTSNFIQKRKYNHGYYVNIFSKKYSVVNLRENTNVIPEIKSDEQQQAQSDNHAVPLTTKENISSSYQQNDKLNKSISTKEKNLRTDKNDSKVQQLISAFNRKNIDSFPKIEHRATSTLSHKVPKGIFQSLSSEGTNGFLALLLLLLLIIAIIIVCSLLATVLTAIGLGILVTLAVVLLIIFLLLLL